MTQDPQPITQDPKPVHKTIIWATGRRKTSVASISMRPGNGKILVNSKSLENYFGGHLRQKAQISKVLKFGEGCPKQDIYIKVTGGGVTGQAGAIVHGVARALVRLDEKLHRQLRKEGFLTRDDRMVERKKARSTQSPQTLPILETLNLNKVKTQKSKLKSEGEKNELLQ